MDKKSLITAGHSLELPANGIRTIIEPYQETTSHLQQNEPDMKSQSIEVFNAEKQQSEVINL